MKQPAPNIVAAAKLAFNEYGILPSIQIAQFALESAWGTKCTGKYNFFGVKAVLGQGATVCWTHEQIGEKLIAVVQKFRNYNSIEDAFLEHAHLLSNPEGPYKKALPFIKDVTKFVNTIGPIYATDKNYSKNLLALIKSNGLQKYD